MKIAIGSDHRGFDVKKRLAALLEKHGHEVIDLGPHTADSVDYPDYAFQVAQAVGEHRVDRGVLICGSGIGASVAANKLIGIRAGICHDTYSGHQGVEHDNMNVLVMGSRVVGEKLAEDIVRAYLPAKFTHEERHARRLAKVAALEQKICKT